MRGRWSAPAAYYSEHGRLTVSAVRAKRQAKQRSAGVQTIETRVSGVALLVCQRLEPLRVSSRFQSARPRVNDLTLARGRWPDPARADEILLVVSPMRAPSSHRSLDATIHGTQTHRIVGIANSPEFVFVAAPGELPAS
jgi:putative ABC transport system permease protein